MFRDRDSGHIAAISWPPKRRNWPYRPRDMTAICPAGHVSVQKSAHPSILLAGRPSMGSPKTREICRQLQTQARPGPHNCPHGHSDMTARCRLGSTDSERGGGRHLGHKGCPCSGELLCPRVSLYEWQRARARAAFRFHLRAPEPRGRCRPLASCRDQAQPPMRLAQDGGHSRWALQSVADSV